ncbi:MAG: hypothetical protein EBY51_07660, partial [Actinobacteria bacterium]|nr:hypothetical protein [Actinomycetota bacterium]
IQQQYGTDAIGGITSSRCTNEEVYVVQKMVRAAFGTNNVDTCARVCHSPTGYGLKQTFGTSAGTQDFTSVADADVIVVIGANPTDAHPVFASRMKRRLREGAELIVVDPRSIGLVRSAHVEAAHHLQLLPGTNVAVVNAISHVVVTDGLVDRAFVEQRCNPESFRAWEAFIRLPENSPETLEQTTGVPADQIRAAARAYALAPNAAIYYGLGVTEHSQGSTMVMAMANLAMATGNIGRSGVGVNPLRGQNNVQGSCDMGSFPHEFSGYRHVSDDTVRQQFADLWGTVGSVQWPCNDDAPQGTPIMHVDRFVRGEGQFVTTPYVPTDERSTRKFPLLLTTGRILSQYNVGAQTRRTNNVVWHTEDVLDMHESDAEARGVRDGDWVEVSSRAGSTRLRARITDDIPAGVVYTTFHHPVSGTNVITTDSSDWATNCPEYKVTAVQVRPSSQVPA